MRNMAVRMLSTTVGGDSDNIATEEEKSIHETFKEADELRKLITDLDKIWEDTIALETSAERFRVIIDDYLEQPHLIDPYLEELLSLLLKKATDPNFPKAARQQAFGYLYQITKMRGFKHVVRLLPHEVSDMEPLLKLIEAQDLQNFELWETRYILLLWLSIVCMIPFDLKRLDSSTQQKDGRPKQRTMDRIMSICKGYLSVNDKGRDAASYLMSRFLTRLDVKQELLPEALDWMMRALKDSSYKTVVGRNQLCGVLATLALLFKNGKREDLLHYAPIVLKVTLDAKLEDCNNCVIRKFVGKLIQRLGLTFLKVRLASWRYQRGNRSLAANLGGITNINTEGKGSSDLIEENDDDTDVPDEIEEIIEHMLVHLKDRETIVRWTAAKGIGRVTGRLPRELADDVVASVLDLFSYQESDSAWHGGCLALAELGRRGLLLPERLQDVVPVIIKALSYDDRRGNFSVGAHVRDAACYVCWAFARAYEPKDINPYVEKIANCLVIASVFDREINVRRAAAAAFQENVGRQGTFPHGIDILTTVDYFAVGNRPRCYIELSVFIAQFKEYTKGVITHLADIKLGHWDSVIRELSAKGLSKLTVCDPNFMTNEILPKLIPLTTGLDLFQRHGTLLGTAEIVHALSNIAEQRKIPITNLLGENLVHNIQAITQKLEDAKMFRRHGGELMRTAELWQSVINECLTHIEPEIRSAAVCAIPAFFTQYYAQNDGSVNQEKQESVISLFLQELKSVNMATRQGFSLALGAVPKSMSKGHLSRIISGLVEASKIKEREEHMAESRSDAVTALSSVCKTVGVEKNGDPNTTICASNLDTIYDALFNAMNDYTLDSRGDIGAWVREASMQAIHDITILVTESDSSLLCQATCKKIFCCFVQQAVEKIDRTRNLAGKLFGQLIFHSPSVPHIPHEAEVKSVFTKTQVDTTNWSIESDTFPLFSQLLAFSDYTYSILLGFVISVGGLTESIVKNSSASLQEYLKVLSEDSSKLSSFMEVLITIFKDYQKDDRVSLPLMRTLDHMLSWGLLSSLSSKESDSIPEQLVRLVKTEKQKSGKPKKIMAAADVFCGLLQFEGSTRTSCLHQLMILLCHSFPRVRKTTSDKLYEALLTYDEVMLEENTDEIMTILSETKWDSEEMVNIKEERNKLCDLLQTSRPVAIKKSS